MEQEEFCLKWSNYLDVLHGAFLSVLNSENFTDVTLFCDSESIKCHRLILSSCSSYFETLFLGISHSHPIIILKDVKFHDLQALVKFMYTGEVTVPPAQTRSLIKLAEMLKVNGLAYSNETATQIQKPRYPSQNFQITQPATEGDRVDTTCENSILAEDSSSDLEPPVADSLNDSFVNYPSDSSSSVYKTDIGACNSLTLDILSEKEQVKDEFAEGFGKGRDNSSTQFEDDEEHFDYGNENLTGSQILERTEIALNGIINSSEVEEAFPDFSEDIFGRKNLILSPKHEDIPLVVSPVASEQLNLNFRPSESTIRQSGRVGDSSSTNAKTLLEASRLNSGLHSVLTVWKVFVNALKVKQKLARRYKRLSEEAKEEFFFSEIS
ncbi:hypothetical protein QYM36_017823 [Artemia franciscana]|uniref:BTB domain-containing protein n=1 Tax=Artemia franciscana TaxID=6661 RepID=A0AA88H3K2_ARTSF|nr:hypothetical protein QYM36_017823 [Artemia franciscana]